ncbi:MAG: hypothetical protein KBS51_03305, partial [Lachnospiraceae bacterium]|nr:hypothetical protein [Candidatus Darwinimomas equi]
MKTVFKKFTGKNWLLILAIFILTVIQVACMMSIADKVGMVTINIQKKDLNAVWSSGMALAGAAVLLLASQMLTEVCASWNAADIISRLRELVYKRVNAYALSDLDAFSTESLITRTTNDMQNLHLALITCFRVIFLVPVLVIWSITKILTYDRSLMIASGLWIAILIAVVRVLVALLLPRFNSLQEITDELNV